MYLCAEIPNIDHQILLEQLSCYIKDRFLLNLLCQYLKRTVHRGGLYRDITQGISRGCPLSPIIGAFHLKVLDDGLSKSGLYYVRYMDDILIMAPTRWKLRRGIKLLNHVFHSLALEQHPDKTFIGYIKKGFDFLGYHFGPLGLTAANDTVKRFVERVIRLYEREQEGVLSKPRLGSYVRRWFGWFLGGLPDKLVVNLQAKTFPNQLDFTTYVGMLNFAVTGKSY